MKFRDVIDTWEKKLALGAGLLLLASFYFLFLRQDEFQRAQTTKELLGIIRPMGKEVTLKSQEEFSFEPIYNPQGAFESDTVSTGASSQAQVELQSGTQFLITPGSLVVLMKPKKMEEEVILRRGGFYGEIAQGKKIRLKTPNRELEITGSGASQISLKTTEDNKVIISTLQGRVEVKEIGQEQATVVEANQRVEISEQPIKKISFPIRLITPQALKPIWIKSAEKIAFQWDNPNKNAEQELLISLDPEMKSMVRRVRAPENRSSLTLNPQQVYFWQIQSGENQSPISQFTLALLDNPKLLVANPKLEIPDGQQSVPVEFRWQDNSWSQEYELLIASDAQFSSGRMASKTKLTEATQNLPQGKYFAKVVALHAGRENLESNLVEIEVRQGQPLAANQTSQNTVDTQTDATPAAADQQVASETASNQTLSDRPPAVQPLPEQKLSEQPLSEQKLSEQALSEQTLLNPGVGPQKTTAAAKSESKTKARPKRAPAKQAWTNSEPDAEVFEVPGLGPEPQEIPIQEKAEFALPSTAAVEPVAHLEPMQRAPSSAFSDTLNPQYWLSTGAGLNYTNLVQQRAELDAKYRKFSGPSLFLEGGFKLLDQTSIAASYKQTPGSFDNSALSSEQSQYQWKTYTLEAQTFLFGRPRLEEGSFTLLYGLQYHNIPYASYDASTYTADLKYINSLNASLGLKYVYFWSERGFANIFMRGQYPISASDPDSPQLEISSPIIFDGTLGAEYRLFQSLWGGLYWYGQYHSFSLQQGDTTRIDSGNQNIIYSNLELRFTLRY